MRPTAILLLIASLSLAACGSGGPPAPDWKKDSIGLIDKYSKAELQGKTTLAEHYFAQAIEAAGSAGQIGTTARLQLIRCATRQASLTFEPCNAYTELARLDPSPSDENYFHFLNGQTASVVPDLLPEQYRSFAKSGNAKQGIEALEKIADPRSRLIAISILVQAKQADDDILALAAETASRQGWRKPLLVYLKLLENHASLRGENNTVDRLRTRIRLVEESVH